MRGIFAGYDPDDSFYDEIFSGPGDVRMGWHDLLSAVAKIGRPELMRRWLQAQEEIHETGIAYKMYDESAGIMRPWELDLLPQLIAADEWSVLAAGLEAAGGFAESHSGGSVRTARVACERPDSGRVAIFASWFSSRVSRSTAAQRNASCTCMLPTWPVRRTVAGGW